MDESMRRIGEILKNNLPWLDNAFGRAWKIERIVNGRRYREPCIYEGGAYMNYLTMLPSMDLGNYCFFYVKDPQDFGDSITKVPISLIFWFNVEQIRGDRSTDALKEEILNVLRNKVVFPYGSVTFNRCYEEYKNVFDGFTVDDNDNQAFVHPYAGFRFDGTMYIEMPCMQ